jgi:hypothetical protein
MKLKTIPSSISRFFSRLFAFWPERIRWVLYPFVAVAGFLLIAGLMVFHFQP